jgi:FtsH-binding integral membrane protein
MRRGPCSARPWGLVAGRSQDIRTAPLLAASIFLDILNVFLLLLSLFGGGRD